MVTIDAFSHSGTLRGETPLANGNKSDVMAPVPPGGYQQSRTFDQSYSELLRKLETAWSTGQQAKLDEAIADMFSLTQPARVLMQQPLSAGGGNLGPSFQYIPLT